MNLAVCADGLSSFTCTCILGFSGLRCETDINDCASNPCKNGGDCRDGVNSYFCNCPDGFQADYSCDAEAASGLSPTIQTVVFVGAPIIGVLIIIIVVLVLCKAHYGTYCYCKKKAKAASTGSDKFTELGSPKRPTEETKSTQV